MCTNTNERSNHLSHTNMHQHIDTRINVRAGSNRIPEAISSRVISRIHDAVLRSNFHCTNICTKPKFIYSKQFMMSTQLFLLAREFLKECIFDAFVNSFSNRNLKTNTSSNVFFLKSMRFQSIGIRTNIL